MILKSSIWERVSTKNVAECFFSYIFFVKCRNVQLCTYICMYINFINFFCPLLFRNNSISGGTSLKALRKESLNILFWNIGYLKISKQLSGITFRS